jgi:hypothetical protein
VDIALDGRLRQAGRTGDAHPSHHAGSSRRNDRYDALARHLLMNPFGKLGCIEYKDRIRVHKSLLNVVLRDQLPEENSSRPKLLDSTLGAASTARRARVA